MPIIPSISQLKERADGDNKGQSNQFNESIDKCGSVDQLRAAINTYGADQKLISKTILYALTTIASMLKYGENGAAFIQESLHREQSH